MFLKWNEESFLNNGIIYLHNNKPTLLNFRWNSCQLMHIFTSVPLPASANGRTDGHGWLADWLADWSTGWTLAQATTRQRDTICAALWR